MPWIFLHQSRHLEHSKTRGESWNPGFSDPANQPFDRITIERRERIEF